MSPKIPEEYFPSKEFWPDRVYTIPEVNYPETLNAARTLLDDNVRQGRGEKVAVYYKDQKITYRDLLGRVSRLSAALRKLGVEKGERVVLRFFNRPEFIIGWLAVLRRGAVAVSTMPLLRARELSYMINDSEAKVALVDGELYEEVHKVRGQIPTVKNIIVSGAGTKMEGCLSFEELLLQESAMEQAADTSRSDLALIAYSSGSTGAPKGTMHFHDDILAIADSYAKNIIVATETDLFGGHPTLAFTYGLGGLLIFPFRFGASTVLLDKFTPRTMLETVHGYKISVLFCTPTTYRLMMAEEGIDVREMTKSVRLCVSAGETLPAVTYNAWKERTGVEILDGIGSTEMLHMFVSSRKGEVKPGSTGVPVPGYRVKVIGENFEERPAGQPGLIAVKGPTGCRYWRKPERQREYVRRGWNIPGDVFIKDEEGYFWYQCRNDDMIICGGYKISGPEVENLLIEHPAVKEAAVVASPDPVRGFVPKAFIVLNGKYSPSEELAKELQEFVKKELALYKYPRKVEFIDSLPKTETGKIKRFELRQREKETA